LGRVRAVIELLLEHHKRQTEEPGFLGKLSCHGRRELVLRTGIRGAPRLSSSGRAIAIANATANEVLIVISLTVLAPLALQSARFLDHTRSGDVEVTLGLPGVGPGTVYTLGSGAEDRGSPSWCLYDSGRVVALPSRREA